MKNTEILSKYSEIVFYPLTFMVSLAMNLIIESNHKYEKKKYHYLELPKNYFFEMLAFSFAMVVYCEL